MSKGRAIILCLALAHLVLVAAGAAGLTELAGRTSPGRFVRWYGALSGADAGYNFFAPRVGSELRVSFVLYDGAGRRWEDDLRAGSNQEVRLRLGSVAGMFPAHPEAEDLRHDLTASWAAVALGRHPDAEQVLVCVEVYEVPTMADYRAGRRPAWQPVYLSAFARTPTGPQKTKEEL